MAKKKQRPKEIDISIELSADKTECKVIFTCKESMNSDDLYSALKTMVHSYSADGEVALEN